jgi:hypothetical protein
VLLDPNPWGVKKGGCYASRPEHPLYYLDAETLLVATYIWVLRVLPHSSSPAILSKTRLRMRLWTSRGSCPCPRRFIWGWGLKVAEHLGGGGLPDTPSAGGTGLPFSRRSIATALFALFRGKRRPPLAKTLSGSLGPPRSPRKARVEVLARDLLVDREAVVWRGETLLLDPRRRWEVV